MKPNTERLEYLEERVEHAYTILATMLIASGFIICIAPWIPELLLHTATGTLLGAGIGVLACTVVRMVTALEQIGNM